MASKIRWIGELLCGLPSQMDTWSYHEQQAAGFSQLPPGLPSLIFSKGFFFCDTPTLIQEYEMILESWEFVGTPMARISRWV